MINADSMHHSLINFVCVKKSNRRLRLRPETVWFVSLAASL